MVYNAKKAACNKKWDAANLDRLSIAISKGYRDIIKQAATAAGQSVNAYIVQAIRQRMDNEQADKQSDKPTD